MNLKVLTVLFMELKVFWEMQSKNAQNMQMDKVSSSETSATISQSTRHHIPDDCKFVS
jgi:hypothetical protein